MKNIPPSRQTAHCYIAPQFSMEPHDAVKLVQFPSTPRAQSMTIQNRLFVVDAVMQHDPSHPKLARARTFSHFLTDSLDQALSLIGSPVVVEHRLFIIRFPSESSGRTESPFTPVLVDAVTQSEWFDEDTGAQHSIRTYTLADGSTYRDRKATEEQCLLIDLHARPLYSYTQTK